MRNIYEIVRLIPYGKENRISKKNLASKLDLGEKELIELIKELRKKYIILVNPTDGCLYRTRNRDELEAFIKEKQRNNFEITRAIQIAYDEIESLERRNRLKEKIKQMASRNTS